MRHSCVPISRSAASAALLVLALLAAACQPLYEAVGPGQQTVAGTMHVTKSGPWVRVAPRFAPRGPSATWTIDGPALNMLLIFAGVGEGQPLSQSVIESGATPPPVFRRGMDGIALQDLVRATVARELAGGVAPETLSLAPAMFMGAEGFATEFAYPSVDGLEMRGFAQGAVVDGRLHLVLFVAPRVHFYDKDIREVRAIAASARSA